MADEKMFYVYLLASDNSKVIYTGVTSNLKKRIYEHKNGTYKGFTSKYNVNRLLYFEQFGNAEAAISREKQIKAGSRKKKEALIEKMNKNWKDLYDNL